MNNMTEKYTPGQHTVGAILNYIANGEIAIPEIQRPFVWKGRQVRDLIDSLYNGYKVEKIYASRFINSKADGRGKISEIIVRNY